HKGGTGLGLSLSRALARAQGGDVTLANRDDGGAIVAFDLPVAP
ncbi:MAG: ATP-binding protein, partial [Tagaea sp.]